MKAIIVLFIATIVTFSSFAQKSKGKSPIDTTTARIQYTCPNHPQMVSDQLGTCPKCNTAFVVDRRVSKQVKKVYSCTMHPDVVSDKPGKCSVCGMDMTEVKTKAKSKKS